MRLLIVSVVAMVLATLLMIIRVDIGRPMLHIQEGGRDVQLKTDSARDARILRQPNPAMGEGIDGSNQQ